MDDNSIEKSLATDNADNIFGQLAQFLSQQAAQAISVLRQLFI